MQDDAAMRDLLARGRAGDHRAFGELHGKFENRMRLWLEASTGNLIRRRTSPEDLSQEVWVQAFKSLPTFEGDTADAFFAWLRGIATNRVRDAHKHVTTLGGDVSREVPG